MSFRFNFSGGDVEGNDKTDVPIQDEIQWLESEEIIPSKQIENFDTMVTHAKMFACGDVEIGHIVISEALANMTKDSQNAPKLAEDESSDLVIGKYEGGLKIWECTYDLIEYLNENEYENKLKDFQVLDLGCGAGILGIYAFLNGSFVTFQDYNREVLEYVTIPNILLNIEDEDNREKDLKRCKFFSGDWASFNEKLDESTVFDLIITSETIYNEVNYNKLLDLFKKRLSENGKVYVAAKTCYFGVGGGVRSFESLINKDDHLKCEVCWKNTEGIQREIIKITRK